MATLVRARATKWQHALITSQNIRTKTLPLLSGGFFVSWAGLAPKYGLGLLCFLGLLQALILSLRIADGLGEQLVQLIRAGQLKAKLLAWLSMGQHGRSPFLLLDAETVRNQKRLV